MAIDCIQLGLLSAPHYAFVGNGYLAGEGPATADPDDPDGRAKKLNVPARVRICIYERGSMYCVADTLSDIDGTWKIEYLDPMITYIVIGYDELGLVNAAIQDWVQPALMP